MRKGGGGDWEHRGMDKIEENRAKRSKRGELLQINRFRSIWMTQMASEKKENP